MKQKLLFIGLLLFFAFGCSKEDDIIPSNQLLGKYEFIMENVGNNYELDFVNTLEFKIDGSVYGEGFTIKSGTDQVLGYRFYFNGKYEIEEGNVIISEKEVFQNMYTDIFYAPKNEFIYLEEGMGSENYLIKSEFKELHSICPPYADCLQVIYKKTS
ncbi:hypothetical protein JYB64_07710 [Algoriphagus aestuarii]|nr:hypothetical protein [Algoriphagus aestuarii]